MYRVVGILGLFCFISQPVLAKGLNGKLLDAVLSGNVEKARTLIKKGADVNHTVAKGESLLMCAADRGYVGVIDLLLKNNATVNHRSKRGDNALSKAANMGRLDAAESILAAGGETNVVDKEQKSPLVWAAERRDFVMLMLLLEKGANVNHQDKQGWSALHYATRHGLLPMMLALLETGADADVRDKTGLTPLMTAVLINQPEPIRLLLLHGANPEIVNENGQSALTMTADWNSEIKSILTDPPQIADNPMTPAIILDKTTVRQLIDRGASIDKPDKNGHTAIFHAVRAGDSEAVRLLIDSGADIHHVGSEGVTPLMLAVAGGRTTMTQLLLEKGADANATSENGFTALYIAGSRQDQRMAEMLMEAGAYKVAQHFDNVIELPKKGMRYRRLRQQIGWLPNFYLSSFVLSGEQPSQPSIEDIPRVGQKNVTPPVFTKHVPPKMPETVRGKFNDYVILEAILGKDGRIRNIRVLRTIENGRYGFEASAINALRQWKFTPGSKDGIPSDVNMTLKVDFVMQ